MMEWECVKGSEADFEGAPEWATMIISGGEFTNRWFLESFEEGKQRHERVEYSGSAFYELDKTKEDYTIIAERRKVDSLQTRVNDANFADEIRSMFEGIPGCTVVTSEPNKYARQCKGVTIDVYDVINAWGVSNPALQHLIKKALQAGQRGHKDRDEDLHDILASAKRAIELEEQAR